MRHLRIHFNNILDNARYVREVEDEGRGPVRVRIGRREDNEIVLPSPFVPPVAAVLDGNGSNWRLTALGQSGCSLDGVDLPLGAPQPVGDRQVITIWPFRIHLDVTDEPEAGEDERRRALEMELARVIRAIHVELLPRIRRPAEALVRHQADEELLEMERHLEDVAQRMGLLVSAHALVDLMARHCVRTELLGRLVRAADPAGAAALDDGSHWGRLISKVPDRERELDRLLERLVARLDLLAEREPGSAVARLDREFWHLWDAGDRSVDDALKTYLALRHLKKEVKDIVFGFGPLEDLLRDPAVTEIMVVDRDRIYVERNGEVEDSGRRFVSDTVTLAIIERIVARVGRRIDKAQPMVDARLPDGSRVNAVIPPLALSGPCLTIRKFPRRRTLEQLLAEQSLSRPTADFLRAAVLARLNILVSGATGTGKTTMLNCLGDFIPDRERIVTIEDTAELSLRKQHIVRLEVKERNVEGAGAYTIRDLVRNALRMRPDRIVVGEVRGAEAFDMLQAMNTGHDGSLCTIHANSAEDVGLRLEAMVQMAADMPVASIQRQIASAVDLIVHLRWTDARRRVVGQITEVVDVDPVRGGLRLRDLFRIDEASDRLEPTGSLPSCVGQLVEGGLIDLHAFYGTPRTESEGHGDVVRTHPAR